MAEDKDVTRIVRTWLRNDDGASADAVLETVLFELATTPQHRLWPLPARFGRMSRRARLGVALGAAAVLVLVAGSFWRVFDAPAGVGTSPSPAPTGRTWSSGAPQPRPLEGGVLPAGRVLLADAGITFSVEVTAGWEHFGDSSGNYISKSVRGPQGAEGVIFWTAYPASGEVAYECHYLRSRGVAASANELAAFVTEVPGTEVVAGSAEVTLDGLPAHRATIVVRDDVGCDPGFFFLYPNVFGGALWPETEPGDTVTAWIVDVAGRLLFIEAKTKPDAGASLINEIEGIVGSIHFE